MKIDVILKKIPIPYAKWFGDLLSITFGLEETQELMEESWRGQNGGIHSEAIKNKETKNDKMSTPPHPFLILSLHLTMGPFG